MDVETVGPTSMVQVVKAVTLRQEIFERPFRRPDGEDASPVGP
jgi:hypothetical protein